MIFVNLGPRRLGESAGVMPRSLKASSGRDAVESLIMGLPLFADVRRSELQAVLGQCTTMQARRDAILARHGEQVPGVFAIGEGSVKLALRSDGADERVLRVLGPGKTFAQASALLGEPLPYDALALKESQLVVVPTAAVFALIEADPRFARHLVLKLAESELELYGEMQSATFQTSAQRLASYLDQLARAGGSCTVQLPFSKTLLASRLGMKKETLSRLLRRFSSAGLIDVTRGEIAIRDRDRLIAAARTPPQFETGKETV